MITVHLVFQAHLDPIWLWPWPAGVDAALATCHSACDRLDANPELIFTRGEAWVYQQVEKLDLALFQRIERHVKSGRWEIVGGWVIQPDCNLPSGWGMDKQIELGKRYFTERFGRFPRIGYNVDTFGHAATLPDLMHKHGQDCYVYMRPQEHELDMPHRIFRWRGREGGKEVTTFHIADAYLANRMNERHIRRSLEGLPEGIEHTMCFVGVGDHGGGPTEKLIAWCREHQSAFDGIKLEFSSPSRFFKAIEKDKDKLPVVTGELQYHAIGCYSIHRGVKTGVRKAEHLLLQAEQALKMDPRPEADAQQRIDQGWWWTCFNQFHDILGGTCIPSAYEQVLSQLGGAKALADEIVNTALRRKMRTLGPEALQQIVLYNASDQPYEGYVQCEPWREWRGWRAGWNLVDEAGKLLPVQAGKQEAVTGNFSRLWFRLRLEANQVRVMRIDDQTQRQAPVVEQPLSVSTAGQLRGDSVALDLEARRMMLGSLELSLPRLELLEDLSDTWSHGIDRYGTWPATAPRWDAPILTEAGPLMASLVQHGRIGDSALLATWRLFSGAAFVELTLRIHWAERLKLLKLTLDLPERAQGRIDGILGGHLPRPCSGQERPLRDWTLVQLGGNQDFGVVCPDVYALDCNEQRLRFTLLRSAILAHHDPTKIIPPHATVADQGEHEFRFRFLVPASPTVLEQQAMMLQRPILTADLTRGMTGEW